MTELRALLRGLALVWQAAPVATTTYLVVNALRGVAPAILITATARLIGLAPILGHSTAATPQAVEALAVIGVALLVGNVASVLPGLLFGYVSDQYQAAFDARRMTAVAALPGLEHFETPALADRLLASTWAARGPRDVVNSASSVFAHAVAIAANSFVLARLGWWAPLVVLATALPFSVNSWLQAASRTRAFRQQAPQLRHASYHLRLSMDRAASREVRLFDLAEWLLNRQRGFWTEGMQPVFRALQDAFRRSVLLQSAVVVGFLIPLAVALVRLRNHQLDVEDFSASVLALAALAAPITFVQWMPGWLREAAAFLPEAFEVLGLARTDPRLDTSGRADPPSRPAQGIAFEGVTFTYPGTDRDVLHGLDLVVGAGESLAIVGENGAGKSTIIKLLCRFYDPQDGRITLDGRDLREYDLAELRSRMAVVFQDFMRLPFPFRDNVAIGSLLGANDTQSLERSARNAGADELVSRLPRGWDTDLGPEFGGTELSGGEWQRVALARAMLARDARDARILILDEPTAALDVRLEADLYQRFAELTEGLTTILISHRFSTVRMAHQIAVLEGGRVVERGSHRDLISAGGRYATLFNLQAARFRASDDVQRD